MADKSEWYCERNPLGVRFARGPRPKRSAATRGHTGSTAKRRIGRYIVEYEQHGADRAKYGSRLLSTLARDLSLKHGSGFNRNNLQYMRKLYRAFPICTTLSCKLSWSHYLEILKCSDELEIGFYVAECVRSNWNVRELRRQMKSSLFERLALSKDKQGVLELAHKGNEVQSPEDILRDHYVLEFSGIKPGHHQPHLREPLPALSPRQGAAQARTRLRNRGGRRSPRQAVVK